MDKCYFGFLPTVKPYGQNVKSRNVMLNVCDQRRILLLNLMKIDRDIFNTGNNTILDEEKHLEVMSESFYYLK